MTPAEIKELAVTAHLAGLVPGLAFALAADALALSSLVRPLGPRALKILRQLHNLILMALALLWLSGLTMIWLRLGPMEGSLTPKLMVKLGTVTLLSLNAVIIGRFVLPRMRTCQGQVFGQFPAPLRMQLALIGSISTACWSSALALGLVKALAPMGFASLGLILGPVLLASIVGGIVMARTAPWLAALAPRDRAAPAHV